ncbi:MAG: mechanosensitive ion channel, partial [Bacteroidaceae bacterium]|nr:mechanosensitive ion channel [Bacteroidaceae bacterium]
MNEMIVEWLKDWGVNPSSIYWLYWILMVLLLAIIIYVLHLGFNKGLVPLIRKVTKGTTSKWDDILLNDTFLSDVSYLIPSIVIACVLPLVIPSSDMILEFLLKVNYIYMVVAIAKMLCTFLNSLYAISNQTDKLKNHPLKGIYQMLKIVVVCVALIIIINILINKNPGYILTALGASAAVLMLVFKDMIMGLVAGVQLSANDMLRPGDWISMPKHGADGSVVEVTLTTVKVQNWDKTITTIPPYCLISDSFQNWRGMTDSGGRRIKRSVYIDMRSITFCTKEQLKEFEKKGWLEGIERE